MGKQNRKLSNDRPTPGRENAGPVADREATTTNLDGDSTLQNEKEETKPLQKTSAVLARISEMDRFYARVCSGCHAAWIMAMDQELVFVKGETICSKCGSKVTGTIVTDKDDVAKLDLRQSALPV